MSSKSNMLITETASAFFGFSWRFPLLRVLSSRHPVVLLYHGIPAKGDGASVDAEIFERHVEFLQDHCELIRPDKISATRRATDKIQVVLTFDDGFRNNAEVVAPILRRHQVPALFFICSRHAIPGKYLWFSYLRALEAHFPGDYIAFRGKCLDMSPKRRTGTMRSLWDSLLRLKPHPQAMYTAIDEELPRLEEFVETGQLRDCYAGMTAEQVNELAADSLFSIGAHTADHPFLTKCDSDEVKRQIVENKRWIEQVTNRPCESIAYPSGAYNRRVIEQCREIGFVCGYAVTAAGASGNNFELPRIGIYSTARDILGFKVQWGNLIRCLRLPIG